MDWLTDPRVWASFVTLSALEIVLGVDNLVFLALLAGRLPQAQQRKARTLGLGLALGARLALLGSIAWMAHMTQPVVSVGAWHFSWRDLIFLGGGGFLLFKSTREIHLAVDIGDEDPAVPRRPPGFLATIVQIMLFDLVFSLDSVITAVGIASEVWVMVAAIVLAIALMLVLSAPLAGFIERNPSVKMLALSFLLLIGMMLVADGLHFHVPREYLYAAMGFSVLVESLNLMSARRRRAKAGRPR